MNREACQRSKVDTQHVNVPLTDQEKDLQVFSKNKRASIARTFLFFFSKKGHQPRRSLSFAEL
jgi:hypothetical protein